MATGTIQKSMVKLWESTNLSANFAAGSIPLDLSNYSAVFVTLSFSNGTIYGECLCIVGSGGVSVRYISAENQNLAYYHRTVTATPTGVSFSDCTKVVQGTTATIITNALLVPYHIYGIRL